MYKITTSLNKSKFLVVQGRTITQTEEQIQYFPKNWEEEFPIIQELGFDGIEWIFDKKSENTNPIVIEQEHQKIKDISEKFNVSLENIVFDWFMEEPFLRDNEQDTRESIKKLISLITLSAKIGFKRIIFPILENNAIKKDELDKLVKIFQNEIIPVLEKMNIEIHFETDLEPEKELELMKNMSNKKTKICFDMGNSTSFGYEGELVLETMKDYLGTVHIKDRKINGPTVPLGTGDVDFEKIFKKLHDINFIGPFTFQIYRDKNSDNKKLLKESLHYINNLQQGVKRI